MSSIKKVAVIGATSSIGRYALPALLEANFKVTVITYSDEGKSFPPQVKIATTDFSPQSLHEVLKGQDAVLCVLGHAVFDKQIDLINAAAKAGVKRFIPSDFGTPKGPNDVPEYRAILGKKAQAQALLEERAKENDSFTWTSFWNGPLLDRVSSMALFPDFGFDLKNHSATIYDSGNEPFTAMSIGKIGKPIAAVFKRPEETKNRYVRLSALTTSQRAILEALERLTNQRWDTATVSTDEARRQGSIKLQKGDYKGAYVGFLVAQLYEDGAGRSVLDGADNELLEVEPEELDEVVRKALAWV
ncbi:NmrA-like family protein [Colletotrichum acutatum]|uniref:NmrA-like family protein n=1 Tax=Glomerella acutata TaxID=27357 RepID=A0AAD8XCD0_GLOAC|nr:NmrA-like family protein [Colletotrichum acutatum]KAK1712596.1 NmrA-like family protein [Colletotrichum acutatum]